jgi:hypothetical protein
VLPNTAVGWPGLLLRLRASAIAAIGLEATGGCERGVMWALLRLAEWKTGEKT